MRRLFAGLAIAGMALAPGVASAEGLNVGDPAPSLAVSGWVKGEKVERFEPGKTYVVEFWATWCGPCRVSIPHLTELARQYKGKVRFIGVDIWEQDRDEVRPFVEKMGEKMDYSVALDDVPDGGNPNDGKMAKNWMAAADENGIPTAFVVRDGKVAWIGHPMSMDKPLEKIVAGTFDSAAFARERRAEKERERKLAAVQQKILKPFQAKDYKATLAALEEATSDDSGLADVFATVKFIALAGDGQVDKAVALGEELRKKADDDPMALNNLAWAAIDPSRSTEPDPRLAKLAVKAARRADELTKGEDMAVLDTLALALFRAGDVKGAIAAEEKAMKRLEATVDDRDHPYYKEFTKRLEEFRKADSGKAGGR